METGFIAPIKYLQSLSSVIITAFIYTYSGGVSLLNVSQLDVLVDGPTSTLESGRSGVSGWQLLESPC